VVEAGLRSGANSTARHAGEAGRHVMAVPGPVTSAMSAGCHRLVRDAGATLVTGAADVVEQVGRLGADLAPRETGPHRPRDDLPADAVRVLDAVPARRARDAARIAVTAGVDVPTVLGRLGLLEVAGLVERVAAGWRLAAAGRAL